MARCWRALELLLITCWPCGIGIRNRWCCAVRPSLRMSTTSHFLQTTRTSSPPAALDTSSQTWLDTVHVHVCAFNAHSHQTAVVLVKFCLLVCRFWKMADTFTCLKLQGMLGRFGKTPLTDIEGYIELPDGKVCLTICILPHAHVYTCTRTHTQTHHLQRTLSSCFSLHQVLSGSEWGNMLLWDGDLIKVEIGRKDRRTCHAGPIQQFTLDEGELITVGADGAVRVSHLSRGLGFCLCLTQTWPLGKF